jgi:AcrR family transcriptional regulator
MGAKKKRHVARSPEDIARKRDRILDAAMKLLIERGYTKTTMSHVARQAAVGRGTVYWHFDSKDDLFFSLLERETAKVEGDMPRLLETDLPALEKLEALIRGFFQLYGEAPNLLQAFMSVLTGSDEHMQQRLLAYFSSIYGKYDALIEGLLETAKQDGDVRPDLDSRVVAAAIVVMMDAMFIQIYFGLVEDDPERLAEGVISVMRNGYLARPGSQGGGR